MLFVSGVAGSDGEGSASFAAATGIVETWISHFESNPELFLLLGVCLFLIVRILLVR